MTTLFGDYEAPLASTVTNPVMAATAWLDNAQLILDCVRLGYLKDDDVTLDPTYGRGGWWTRWKPKSLLTNDIDRDTEATEHYDFRYLPAADSSFDAVTFDPPYIAQGGRESSTTQDFLSRFGLIDVPTTCSGVQQLIDDGLAEMYRVVRPGGVVLCKCKDYISGGRLWLGTHYTLAWAIELGFEIQDRLEHIAGTGPQPPRPRQLHARRNLSTLFVLRKGEK